ncbi:hypothetical protein CRYUN_Cryun09bG0124000 [Craigia yunnanensis]
MDSVWVPTEFHVSTFVQSGVDPAKVVKVVQSIDVKERMGCVDRCILERILTRDDEVVFNLLTNPYRSSRDFDNKIVQFVEDSDMEKPVNEWAPVMGRPFVEAMAMSLPVITNWSGPTEYLTEENGYPLPVDRMNEVMEGPFKGHLLAEPSVSKLQALMRHVITNVEEARPKTDRPTALKVPIPFLVSDAYFSKLRYQFYVYKEDAKCSDEIFHAKEYVVINNDCAKFVCLEILLFSGFVELSGPPTFLASYC